MKEIPKNPKHPKIELDSDAKNRQSDLELLKRTTTIYEVSINTNEDEDFIIQLGNFMDSFYKAPTSIKSLMMSKPPVKMKNRENIPILAAVTHYLSNKYNLQPPEWVFKKRCYLPAIAPWFDFNAIETDFRIWLMKNSPKEFKDRRVYVGNHNLLSRA
jgi:hypothetical protein